MEKEAKKQRKRKKILKTIAAVSAAGTGLTTFQSLVVSAAWDGTAWQNFVNTTRTQERSNTQTQIVSTHTDTLASYTPHSDSGGYNHSPSYTPSYYDPHYNSGGSGHSPSYTPSSYTPHSDSGGSGHSPSYTPASYTPHSDSGGSGHSPSYTPSSYTPHSDSGGSGHSPSYTPGYYVPHSDSGGSGHSPSYTPASYTPHSDSGGSGHSPSYTPGYYYPGTSHYQYKTVVGNIHADGPVHTNYSYYIPSHYNSHSDTPSSYTPAQYNPHSDTPGYYVYSQYNPHSDTPASYTPAQYNPHSDTPASYTPAQYNPHSDTPSSYTPPHYNSHSDSPSYYNPSHYNAHSDTPSSYIPAVDTGIDHNNYVPSRPSFFNIAQNERISGTVRIGFYSYDKNFDGTGSTDADSITAKYTLSVRRIQNLDGTANTSAWVDHAVNQPATTADGGYTYDFNSIDPLKTGNTTLKAYEGIYEIRAVAQNTLPRGIVQQSTAQVYTVRIEQNIEPEISITNANEFINFKFGYDGALSPANVFKRYSEGLYAGATPAQQDGILVRVQMKDADNATASRQNWQKGVMHLLNPSGTEISAVNIVWENGSNIISSENAYKIGYGFFSKSVYTSVGAMDNATIKIELQDYSDAVCTQGLGAVLYQNTISSVDSTLLVIDTDVTRPTVTADNTNYNWKNTDIAVNLTYQDASGLLVKEYQVTQSTAQPTAGWLAYTTGPVTVSSEGNNYIWYHAVDSGGNEQYGYYGPYKIDETVPTAPQINFTSPSGYANDTWTSSNVTFAVAGGTDALSGSQKTQYRIVSPDGTKSNWTDYASPVTISAEGINRVEARTLDNAGNTSYGLYLNGTSAYAEALNSATLSVTGDMTLEFWFRPTNIGVGRVNPVGKAYGGEFHLTLETNGSMSYYHGSSGTNGGTYISKTIFPSGSFQNNTEYHVAIVRTVADRTIKAYKNGVLVSTNTWLSTEPNPSASSLPVRIGKGYTNIPMAGVIDDIRLWNSARAQTDIQNNMNNELIGSEPGFATYWKFNEAAGTIAYDSTANGNHANLYSASFGGNSKIVKIDKTPISKPTIKFTSPSGYMSDGWANQTVTFTITPGTSGASGVSKTQYRLNNGAWTDYSAAVSLVAEGTTVIEAKSFNNMGVEGPAETATVNIDKAKPTGTISVNDGKTFANSSPIKLTLTANDAADANLDMFIKVNNSTPPTASTTGWIPFASTYNYNHTAGDGNFRFYVWFKDDAGNISNTVYDDIIYDATPATGTVKINDIAVSTDQPAVTLTFTKDYGYANVNKIMISNSSTFDYYESFDYQDSLPWVLDATTRGTKNVYVKYLDWAGNITNTAFSDDINYTGQITYFGGVNHNQVLSVNGTEVETVAPEQLATGYTMPNKPGGGQEVLDSWNKATDLDLVKYRIYFTLRDNTVINNLQNIYFELELNNTLEDSIELNLESVKLTKPLGDTVSNIGFTTDTPKGKGIYKFSINTSNLQQLGKYAIEYTARVNVRESYYEPTQLYATLQNNANIVLEFKDGTYYNELKNEYNLANKTHITTYVVRKRVIGQ